MISAITTRPERTRLPAINYRSGKEAAADLVSELTENDCRVVAVQADVADPDSTSALVDQTVEALGGLDILVSNAGVEHFGSLASITPVDYERVFTTNVAGQLFVTQAAAAAMGDGARIVLTSSVSARVAVFEHSLYAASKAAVSALVLNLAPELATRGIAINAVAPGGTRTDMAAENARKCTPPALRDLPPEKLTGLSTAWGRLANPTRSRASSRSSSPPMPRSSPDLRCRRRMQALAAPAVSRGWARKTPAGG